MSKYSAYKSIKTNENAFGECSNFKVRFDAGSLTLMPALLSSRNLFRFARMASSSPRVKKPPNILVFSQNEERIRKSLKSVLDTDKYVVYGITAADLASAPWQDNAAALVASAEHCDEDSMARGAIQ